MPKEKPKRCAIYTRKSSEEGLEQKFNSLHAQRESCEAFIQSQSHEGWVLYKKQYDDGGFSGGTLERPALQALLSDIKAGKIQVIVVYKIDRLTRSLTDFAKLVETLDEHGVSFVSVTQHFNTTTSMGRLTLNVLLSFAQYEREVTGERIRDKFLASRKKGMWMGGHPPLGYDIRERKLHVNREEAKQVNRIFELYLKTGCVSRLQGKLEQENITSKEWTSESGVAYGGKSFSRGAIYTILKNPTYIGEVLHKGKTYEGEHEGIVSRELWDKVQNRLKKNRQKRKLTHDNSSLYPLRGLLFNDRGTPFIASYAQKKDGRRYRYYICSQDQPGENKKTKSTIRLPAKEIEDVILEGLKTHPSVSDGIDWNKARGSIKRIVVKKDKLKISLAGHMEPPSLKIPYQVKKKGNQTLLMGPNGEKNHYLPRIDPSLLKSLAKAWEWRRLIEKGEVGSFSELSEKEECTERYIRKLLSLSFLHPEIVEAILNGTQPRHCTLTDFTRNKISLSWKEQNETFINKGGGGVGIALKCKTSKRWATTTLIT